MVQITTRARRLSIGEPASSDFWVAHSAQPSCAMRRCKPRTIPERISERTTCWPSWSSLARIIFEFWPAFMNISNRLPTWRSASIRGFSFEIISPETLALGVDPNPRLLKPSDTPSTGVRQDQRRFF